MLLAFIADRSFQGAGDKRGIDNFGIYILTYIMLGWGLNIVVGLAGLLDLGYVAFYAVGAYAYALLSTVYLPIWFGPGVVPYAFYIVLPLRRRVGGAVGDHSRLPGACGCAAIISPS